MSGVDPLTLKAWLSARSLARGLPQPVPDFGGLRVDTNSDAEISRWVFSHMTAGLMELARSIRAPHHILKLCGSAGELRSALPGGWELHPPGYVMRAGDAHVARPLPNGYRTLVQRTGMVTKVQVLSGAGELAASGYAAETPDVFIYDRIVTEPAHRRLGLGSALMSALRLAKDTPGKCELLVATEEGRALYASMGWQVISPYSSASLPVSAPVQT